jgi:formate hydrogenlyase subunit 3/multisubunit Na+/H+ antiporter MnhD subunit
MIAKHSSHHITKLHLWINVLLTLLGLGLYAVWTMLFDKFQELEIIKTNSFSELFNFVSNLNEDNIEQIKDNATSLIVLFFVFAGIFSSIVSFYLFNLVVSFIMIFKIIIQARKTNKWLGIVSAILSILFFIVISSILDLIYLMGLKKDEQRIDPEEI